VVVLPSSPPTLNLDKEAAGLSLASEPELLTWERVYALTLVRTRGGTGPRADRLDPKALDERATRYGVADFERFSTDFLAAKPGASGSFRDPSGDYLALLRRLQMIDHARRNVAFHENILSLMRELVQGQAGGLSQLDLDLVAASLAEAQQSQTDQIASYRDRIEALKVTLGLSPHAPVILDRQCVAAFSKVSSAIEDWHRRPDRQLQELPRIIRELPVLREILVERRSILLPMRGGSDRREEVLGGAIQLAIKNRRDAGKGQAPGEGDAALELDVRRRIRHLFELSRAYEAEQLAYDVAIRVTDQALERLIAPATASVSPRSPMLAGLPAQEHRRLQVEDRLVTLWTSFQTERLALYRELGILPYDDWNSFLDDLSAR
jgi:hypothetical protein